MKEHLPSLFPAPESADSHRTRFRLVAHCYVWGLFLVLLAFAVPRVEETFANFGIPLPRLTTLVFRASQVVEELSPIIAIPSLLLILLGVDWLMMNAPSKRGEEGWLLAWSMLMFASPLFLIALAVTAPVLPFFTITTHLSG